MQNNPDCNESPEILIETNPKKRQLDRPRKLQSLIDTQAMRFLETMDFQSYDNLAGAVENFMSQAPLFQLDPSFAAAAAALDLTAQLFPVIDRDKNQLLSREEFAYLLETTTAANRQALSWLIENFNAFTQACFFKDQIGKDDVEASRSLFHGLKIAQEKFGFNKQPTLENLRELDGGELKDYLDKNRGSLNKHEASGLKYLSDHLMKHVGGRDLAQEASLVDKAGDETGARQLAQLSGVLDRRSLQTLQTLKLNSFESLFSAFADLLEDAVSFRGDTAFGRAEGALDTTADVLAGLDMGEEHMFSRDELLIISKLTGSKEKKPLGWIARNFEAFTRAFFYPGKTKKKDIEEARNVFHGLGFVAERFNCGEEVYPEFRQQLRKHIKNYLATHRSALVQVDRCGLEGLVEFMERHAH